MENRLREAVGNCEPLINYLGASLALALSFPAYADFTGKVVGVADGDTITVLRDREPAKHGKLFCELCNFRFIEAYPFLKEDVIEGAPCRAAIDFK